MHDHYLTLGVSRFAGRREITHAYRRLARRYHPDVASEPDALERFLAVQQAYETISDPRRRAEHDRELEHYERERTTVRVASASVVPSPASAAANRRAPRRPAPDVRGSTTALRLAGVSAALLPVSLLLADTLQGASRFAGLGIGLAVAVWGSVHACSLAARQLEVLWRWTATGGSPRGSRAVRASVQRIRRADELTLLGRRFVFCGVPVVILLAAH